MIRAVESPYLVPFGGSFDIGRAPEGDRLSETEVAEMRRRLAPEH